MCDLQNMILTALDKHPTSLWTPRVAKMLSEYKQSQLIQRMGMAIEDYGTYRSMTGSSSSVRKIFKSIPIGHTGCDRAIYMRLLIEFLPEIERRRYHVGGLTYYTENDLARSPALECFRDALLTLHLVPDVAECLDFLVRVCHLLKPDDSCSDISFSDPDIPFSIWLSIPTFRVANDGLRVAESILHESMHLQLTLIEEVLPLVSSHEQSFFSPWKGMYRPSHGLLHAVYVFRVIDKFYEQLLSMPPRSADDTRYMVSRRKRIAEEILQSRMIIRYSDFTDIGKEFLKKLLRG